MRVRSFRRHFPALSALLAVMLYAAFDHGAVSLSGQARLNVALAVLALPAATRWAWPGRSAGLSRSALLGLSLLIAFAALNAISILWSVDPDGSWTEFNRVASYLIVLLLGISLGRSSVATPSRVTAGYLIVASAVGLYALSQKLLPGIFDLNEAGPTTRLQQPLGYWNALALLMAFAAVLALGQASDRELRPGRRTAAALALALALLSGGLTLSRGGNVALGAALLTFVLMSRARAQVLTWLLAAFVAAVPCLAFGLLSPALSTPGAGLGRREAAGVMLMLIVVLSAVTLGFASRRLLGIEERLRLTSSAAQRARRLTAVLVVGAALAVLVGLGLSSRGLGGTVSHAWRSFTQTHAAAQNDPGRLLSADSQNRWVWWKEAAGAFSDRPVVGWGAGSFAVVHLLYRRDQLSVRQPHSVPLQWLAETGLLGTVLVVSGLGALALAATRTLRPRRGRSRAAVASMLAVLIAAGIHGLFDWDWDIPALMFPAMLFLGVLAGSAPGPAVATGLEAMPRRGHRVAGLALATSLLIAYALSGVLPSLAANTAASASVTAASGTPAGLLAAERQANMAASLDPLSDAGARVQATIELARRRPGLARRRLLEAIRRQPTDPSAWAQLSFVELSLGIPADATRAADRALALDPRGQFATSLAGTVAAIGGLPSGPPQNSATGSAVGSP